VNVSTALVEESEGNVGRIFTYALSDFACSGGNVHRRSTDGGSASLPQEFERLPDGAARRAK
jgi:hypothetical protein